MIPIPIFQRIRAALAEPPANPKPQKGCSHPCPHGGPCIFPGIDSGMLGILGCPAPVIVCPDWTPPQEVATAPN